MMPGYRHRRYPGVVNLARLDLNLLISLDALLQQRSVTRAAAQMGLSQPALSASLARLRRHFGDELLTRVGNEYRLTPLAAQLRESVRIALTGVERVFSAQSEFDPSSCTREFQLLVSDYVVAVLGPLLVAALGRQAPRARLRLTPHSPMVIDQAEQALVGSDLMFLPHGFISDLCYTDVFHDEWVCVVDHENPAVGRGLTLDELQELPWVVTYHGHSVSSAAVRQLRGLGVEPRAEVITESFLTVPSLVAGSGRVALLQKRLADQLPNGSGVVVLPVPFDVAPLIEAMWWHPVWDGDPEHAFLRDVVVRAGAELDVTG
jgi:DNA-binding transcriptional LysR family regulator